MDELQAEFADKVALEWHLFPVFGDVPEKMAKQWEDRGGVKAYAKHVHEIGEDFAHLNLHPRVWLDAQPHSSQPAHLYLSAIRELTASSTVTCNACEDFMRRLRTAFFCEVRNIGLIKVLDELLQEAQLPVADVKALINNGIAFARLSRDMQLAKELVIRASPTLIFNEDRQRLTGNVGYKIIQANIKELLERPASDLSWC